MAIRCKGGRKPHLTSPEGEEQLTALAYCKLC